MDIVGYIIIASPDACRAMPRPSTDIACRGTMVSAFRVARTGGVIGPVATVLCGTFLRWPRLRLRCRLNMHSAVLDCPCPPLGQEMLMLRRSVLE